MKKQFSDLDLIGEEFKKVIEEMKGDGDGELIHRNPPKIKGYTPEYVDRSKGEVPEELKKDFEKNEEKLRKATRESVGEINMNFDNVPDFKFRDKEGNLMSESTITESGTYVMRDGKLVKGKGKKREKAISNWHSSNADPEDIMRHRELMDRMSYKGPVWDGIGVPKTGMEEVNPTYRKVDKEEDPTQDDSVQKGKHEFETVVR